MAPGRQTSPDVYLMLVKKHTDPTEEESDMWNEVTIPFVILAIVVATGPVIYMTHHAFRHGHLASLSDHARVPVHADPQQFSWAVCSDCKSVVTDPVEHMRVVHHYMAGRTRPFRLGDPGPPWSAQGVLPAGHALVSDTCVTGL